MGLRQCDKCDEMVDEAKAFCPGCGNAFVEEEERRDASKFDELGRTVQFGQTMYNQMLEDMGLDISKSPSPVEKRVEVIEPIKTDEAVEPGSASEIIPVQTPSPETIVRKPKSSNNLIWYILAGLAVIFLLPIALASAVLLVLDIWSRLSR